MRNALFVLGGAGILTALARQVDMLTNMENRLRLTTKGTANLEAVQSKLFQVAKNSRSSFEAVGEIYTRTALSVKNLGRSQQEVIDFTESLSKATIISGASAREAHAAMIQLGQGMASNTLRGDELRSVLEQLPFVADVIAKHLKITRGELREFGKAGKISAETVLDAFKESREEIDKLFANTVPTISQAFSFLETSWLQMLSEFNKATEASEIFSRSIIFLADNLNIIVPILRTMIFIWAANTLASVRFASGIRGVIVAMNVMKIAFLANPLTIIPALIAIAISALFSFEGAWDTVTGLITLYINAMGDAFTTIYQSIVVLWNAFPETIKNAILIPLQFVVKVIKSLILLIQRAISALKRMAGVAEKAAARAKQAAAAANALSIAGVNTGRNRNSNSNSANGNRGTGDRGIAGDSSFTTGGDIFDGSSFTNRTRGLRGTDKSLNTYSDLSRNGGNYSTGFNGTGSQSNGAYSPLGSGFQKLAGGGSIDIGGRSGVDKNVLSINDRPIARVSRGERIDVSPEGKGNGGTTIIFHIQTPDADSFQRSQGQIQAKLQTAQARANERNN
jgi:tape measure domain-containing protein